MEKYMILKKVGEGSFGKVYKARKLSDGEIVAYKVVQKSNRSLVELKSLRQECKIQRRLHHPNIIQMFDAFETKEEIVVVTEYADVELYKLLVKNGRLCEEKAQSIAGDLVSALYYLHSNDVLHRDLKPQNILITSNGVAKLCDFGFARAVRAGSIVLLSIKGTPLYMAPEIFDNYKYDHTADLWSLGCIIYEVIVGSPPFKTNSILHLVKLMRSGTIRWPSHVSQECSSFLQGLLEKDCTKRLKWPDLLAHDFVKDRVIKISKCRGGGRNKRKPIQLKKDSLGELRDNASDLAQPTVSTEFETIDDGTNDSVNSSVPHNYELPDSRNRIEDEEWIPFLQQTMKEIMNGEGDLLLTPHYISIFITPLKMKVIDHRVIQCIACVLSLLFAVETYKKHDEIHCIYRDLKVITHLVNAVYILISKSPAEFPDTDREPNNMDQANTSARSMSMSGGDEIQTLEYTMLLLCRLVHWNRNSAIEFCHAIYATNGVAFLQQLLTLEKGNARTIADFLAILTVITLYSDSSNSFVEEVISFSYVSGCPGEGQFYKLLTHDDKLIRERTCRLIGVLATRSRKSLEQIGYESLKNLVKGLTNDNASNVKIAADETITILNVLT